MRIITAIFAAFFSLSVVYGQTKEVRGVVLDKDDRSPVAGVIVQVKDSSDHPYPYTITNDQGEFGIKYPTSVPDLSLRFQCMSYASQTIRIGVSSSPLTVYLVPRPTQLNDVTVTAPDIEQRSDTLTYYMSKYATPADKNLSDVLKRLPGIKVEENGQIKYHGEPINKFYIDGSDFMDGRYGLATENISPSDVASVDVLENHQPVQVLKGLEFSQRAGLNIKLKEEARHKWIAILHGGAGMSPFLYDASAFAMRIAGKWQNMETVRINRTGWNPASQSRRQIESSLSGNGYADQLWDDPVTAGRLSSPIDEQRTRDNFSMLAHTSNSWRTGEGRDAKFDLTYEGDKLDYLTAYETNYFDEKIPSFIERKAMRTQTHRLGGHWALQVNRPALFLKDNLYLDADWDKATSTIGGTRSLLQNAETPSFRAASDVQVVKRINNRLLTFSSRNSYVYKPQSLHITADNSAIQQVTTGDFRSVTEARYGWLFNRWKVSARGGIDFNHHNIDADLHGIALSYPTRNEMDFSLLSPYLSPDVSYRSSRWLFTLSVPVSYHLHHIRNKLTDESGTEHYASVAPAFSLRHQISAKMDMAAQFKYSLSPPKADMHLRNVMMNDFRNLTVPEDVSEYKEERTATLNVRYRNPITSLFFHGMGRLEWNRYPSMRSQLFMGDYILHSFVPIKNESRNLAVNGSISKGLMSGKLTLGLDAGHVRIWTTSMKQHVESSYVLTKTFVQPYLKGFFTNGLSMDYRLLYTRNTMDIESSGKSAHDVWKQYLAFTIIPDKAWQIGIGGEHYYTRFSSGNSTNLVLLDASVRWTVSKRADFSLTGMNLLNRRAYHYANYGLLSETGYTYNIRGRSIMASVQVRL